MGDKTQFERAVRCFSRTTRGGAFNIIMAACLLLLPPGGDQQCAASSQRHTAAPPGENGAYTSAHHSRHATNIESAGVALVPRYSHS